MCNVTDYCEAKISDSDESPLGESEHRFRPLKSVR